MITMPLIAKGLIGCLRFYSGIERQLQVYLNEACLFLTAG